MANKETAQSLKVLDELFAKLNIAKEASDIKGSSIEIASLINGDSFDVDVPTK